KEAVYAFMVELIDYAGLFPPASLSLPEAFANYARYRRYPDRWMLARFIVPAVRLAELTTLAGSAFRGGEPFSFSVLGRGGADASGSLAALESDRQALATFRDQHGAGVVVDVFEVPLPAAVLEAGDRATISELLICARESMGAASELMAFFEVPLGVGWEEKVETVVAAIAEENRRDDRGRAGFKLRAGGVHASAFPSPSQVAFALAACRDAGVSMKATAGLHHPIRRFDDSIQTRMHGFLNVFGAGILAHVHRLAPTEIQAIIEDEAPAHFSFTDDEFAWKELSATHDEIARLRQSALISYGSCSFDEPREDLRALGILPG
ncbi:MAG: hypothetical protein ACRDIB_17650, partial [Ardenticatenaceae bacterium]